MFSPIGTYPAVGLFSMGHIIALIICLVSICVAVHFTKDMKSETFHKCLKIFGIILTATELFKIGWSFGHGMFNVNSWVPLYFCSFFLYALWFTWSKKEFIKRLGYSYIAMACIVAGTVFLIFPTTSFKSYPIFHFQCLHSLIYHSLMIYSGVMIFYTNSVEINKKLLFSYFAFCSIFMSLSITVNLNFADANMMFLANPGGIPLPFLFTIYNFSNVLYTICMIIAHMSLGLIVIGVHKLFEARARKFAEKHKQKDNEVIDLDEDFEEKHS